MCTPSARHPLNHPLELFPMAMHLWTTTSPYQGHNNHSRFHRHVAIATARFVNERQAFLIFIKILFRIISVNEENELLRRKARAIVFECTYQNRMRHEHYLDLQHAVASRLRLLVGESYWKQARDYLESYFSRRGIQHSSLAALY
jgi:hypothetical protein